jgi:hypothetical protein
VQAELVLAVMTTRAYSTRVAMSGTSIDNRCGSPAQQEAATARVSVSESHGGRAAIWDHAAPTPEIAFHSPSGASRS